MRRRRGPSDVDAVLAVCRRWGLPAAAVGRDGSRTDGCADRRSMRGARARAHPGGRAGSRTPSSTSGKPSRRRRRRAAPAPGAPNEAADLLPERGMDPAAVLQALLGRPEPRLVGWVTSSTTRRSARTPSRAAASGAAILRVKGTRQGLVVATDADAHVGLSTRGWAPR